MLMIKIMLTNNWDRSSAIKLYYQKPNKNNFTLTPTHRKQFFLNHNLSDNVNKINNVKNKVKGDFNFKIYIISLFNSKTPWARRLKLIRKIWKNKISEENILLLSIEIDSIKKFIYENNQSYKSDFSSVK